MAYVSKKPLKADVQKRLDQQFIKTIVNLRTTKGGEQFLSELLTDTERIMLSKRLMIIFLLAEDISQYRIKKILNVSSSTVARTSKDLYSGNLSHLVKLCSKKKSKDILWHELEVIVRLGMPSMGKDRWDWLNKRAK